MKKAITIAPITIRRRVRALVGSDDRSCSWVSGVLVGAFSTRPSRGETWSSKPTVRTPEVRGPELGGPELASGGSPLDTSLLLDS